MTKNQGSTNRDAKIAKAGKRSGQTNWPAPISKERLEAKEKGEQQFVANRQLTAEKEGTAIVFDQKTQRFVYKSRKVTISTEFSLDPTRDRVIYSPSFKEKSK